MRSNSYTFAHVLTLYLILFGAGAAAAGRRAQRSLSPDVTFLWIQFWIGVSSLLGVLALMHGPELFGMRRLLEGYFVGEGYTYGLLMPSDFASAMTALFAHLLAPMLVMGIPVFLMGYAYPFITSLVLQREDTLGRRTGTLMACNIAGNVLGSLLSAFVLLDAFGTAGTLALLGALLMGLGVVAALRDARTRRACGSSDRRRNRAARSVPSQRSALGLSPRRYAGALCPRRGAQLRQRARAARRHADAAPERGRPGRLSL